MGRQSKNNKSTYASTSRSTSNAETKRVKATDLVFNPKPWVKHMYTTLTHFDGTFRHQVLLEILKKPTINQGMGTALLMDDSRNQDACPPLLDHNEIDPMFWICSTFQEFLNMISGTSGTPGADGPPDPGTSGTPVADSVPCLGTSANYTLQLDNYMSHPSNHLLLVIEDETPSVVVDLEAAEAHDYVAYLKAMAAHQAAVLRYANFKSLANEAKAGLDSPEHPGDEHPHPRELVFVTTRTFHSFNVAWRMNNPPFDKHGKDAAARRNGVALYNSCNIPQKITLSLILNDITLSLMLNGARHT